MQFSFAASSESSKHHLSGFEVVVSTAAGMPETTVFEGDVNDVRVDYTVKLTEVMARFITIQRPGVLTICEIIVLEEGI